VVEAHSGYEEQLAVANDELARLVRRLRSLSRLAWLSRREAVELALRQLAEVTAHLEGSVLPALPTIADHALADAMAVIGADCIAALTAQVDPEPLADVIGDLRVALEASR
jgi:hypothetical protein